MAIMNRENLQAILEGLLGSRNVYYQPPSNLKIKYPCIIYSRDRVDTSNANDTVYLKSNKYTITLISNRPDDEAADKIIQLPFCSYDRHYVSDNLHHDVFSLYYK